MSNNSFEQSPALSATYHFHSIAFDAVRPHMGLFLLAYSYSLLLLNFLRLDPFLFIAW